MNGLINTYLVVSQNSDVQGMPLCVHLNNIFCMMGRHGYVCVKVIVHNTQRNFG